MTFTLASPAFENMQEIPKMHTCDGIDISPPLKWNNVPDNTKSLVLIVDDPDAPDPRSPKMIWVHWVIYNLAPDIGELPAGTTSDNLPDGAVQGLNDWKKAQYNGPCPPIGRHRYFFKLYALNIVFPANQKITKSQLEAAMHGHILAQTEIVGTYQK